jgi:hypothetical protein
MYWLIPSAAIRSSNTPNRKELWSAGWAREGLSGAVFALPGATPASARGKPQIEGVRARHRRRASQRQRSGRSLSLPAQARRRREVHRVVHTSRKTGDSMREPSSTVVEPGIGVPSTLAWALFFTFAATGLKMLTEGLTTDRDGLVIYGGLLMLLSFVFGQWPGLEKLRSKRGYRAMQWLVGLMGFVAMVRSLFLFGMAFAS